MPEQALSAALQHEHQQIDAGIATVLEQLDRGRVAAETLGATLDFLRRHIYLEERILFPPIRHGGLMMPLFVMMREHGEIWRTMDTLTAMLADGAEPAAVAQTCRQLVGQLDAHNMKEEPVIYPAADNGLSAEQAAELADFLDTGRTPDAWVCQEA